MHKSRIVLGWLVSLVLGLCAVIRQKYPHGYTLELKAGIIFPEKINSKQIVDRFVYRKEITGCGKKFELIDWY